MQLKINKKILIGSCFLISISILFHINYYPYNSEYNYDEPKSSGIWATLDLDDPPGINETTHQTNSVINVQGRLYNLFDGLGKSGYTVIIYVDGTPYSSFNDVTNGNGDFNIAFTVDPFLDIYTPHIIEVFVDNPIPPGDVDYTSFYIITINTSSYIELFEPSEPKILGEFLEFEGYLRYENGNGIPFETLNYHWYDGSNLVYSDFVFTDNAGEISDVFIPDWAGDDLSLKFNYSNAPYIGYYEEFMLNTKIFSDIICNWNLSDPIIENRQFRIQGQLLSLNNPGLSIGFRTMRILYNSQIITTLVTDANGNFHYTHQLLNGTGLAQVELEIDSPSGILSTSQFIDIEAAPPPPPPLPPLSPDDIPFLAFFAVFIPIMVGLVGGLAGYGYYRYRKSDKESKVVNLPLEDRITNLKILKETGRLEESLSYLFNAIYMDLINAKFGRTRNINETIRDFAIISVKELSLTPARIYPFIQKVEEIIYAKPFQITDKEFYSTIDLFSPIYFELTGYNFVLKF